MPRDLVWISLESVRQDHTTLAGHERDTTPEVAAIADRADGAAFSRCFSHGIWTRTSSASILTGRAPSDHGVLSFDSKLPRGVRTIPEQLAARGYRTACVSPIAQLSAATGLDRGFDDFHYLARGRLRREVGAGTLARYLVNLRRHSAGLTTDTSKHCTGYLVRDLARRHITASTEDPLFLYLHIADSHHPYYPPKGWRETFAGDLDLSLSEALSVAMDMSENLIDHVAHGLAFSDAEWNAIRVMYDTCLRYVDHLAGTIVDSARRHLSDPIVVVTADHGELLGEGGCLAHMLRANTAVSNVPLVVSGLPELDGGDGLVQHADVWQLVSDACGLSLSLPVAADVRTGGRPFAVTQRGGARAEKKLRQIRECNPAFDASRVARGDLTSLRTPSYRYRRTPDGEALFALPDEDTDVAPDRPQVAREFRDRTDAWLADHDGGTDAERAEFSDRMRRQLSDLGYR